MLAGALVDSAIGVLQMTVVSAQGLKAVKIGGGTPDPYVTFSIGTRLHLDRTKVCDFDVFYWQNLFLIFCLSTPHHTGQAQHTESQLEKCPFSSDSFSQ